MSLVAYSLTTRQNLKDVLGITANDTTTNNLLDNIINRATDIIEKYCNGRRFASTAYTNQEYDGTGTKYIDLKHWPVTALTAYDRNDGDFSTTNWNTLNVENIKLIDDGDGPGQVFYSFGFARGVRNYRFTYTAGYSTIPNDIEEACLQLASYIYNDKKNKGMKSESLGEYSYTKESLVGNVIDNLGIDLILEPYRVPNV